MKRISCFLALSLTIAAAQSPVADHEKALKDSCRPPGEGTANVPKCTDEAVWLIKNEPAYQPLAQAGVVVVLSKDQAAIQRVHNAWTEAVKAHPGDEAVKQNASVFEMLIAQSSQLAEAYSGKNPFRKENPEPVEPPQQQQSPAWKYPPCANPMPHEKTSIDLHAMGNAGTVEYILYIAPDGSIADKTLVRGQPGLAQISEQRLLKNWKYKAVPRTCAIDMNISLY